MAKPVFKRVSMTLDTETIRKCRALANEKSQSVSALVRLLIGEAYEEASTANGAERNRKL
jgi:hypothetical protein